MRVFQKKSRVCSTEEFVLWNFLQEFFFSISIYSIKSINIYVKCSLLILRFQHQVSKLINSMPSQKANNRSQKDDFLSANRGKTQTKSILQNVWKKMEELSNQQRQTIKQKPQQFLSFQKESQSSIFQGRSESNITVKSIANRLNNYHFQSDIQIYKTLQSQSGHDDVRRTPFNSGLVQELRMDQAPQDQQKERKKQQNHTYTFSQNYLPDSQQQQLQKPLQKKTQNKNYAIESDFPQNVITQQKIEQKREKESRLKPSNAKLIAQVNSQRNKKLMKKQKKKQKNGQSKLRQNSKQTFGLSSLDFQFSQPLPKKIEDNEESYEEDFSDIQNDIFKKKKRKQYKEEKNVQNSKERKNAFQKFAAKQYCLEPPNKEIEEKIRHQQQIEDQKMGSRHISLPNECQNNQRPKLGFEDLEFEDSQCDVKLVYSHQKNPIKSYEVRYYLQKKQIEQINELICKQTQKTQKTTWVIRPFIQASFCLSEKQLKLITQSQLDPNPLYGAHNSSDQTEISEQAQKKYHFKVYLLLSIQVQQRYGLQVNEKCYSNLFPPCNQQFDLSHSKLHERYIQSLLVLKQKYKIPQPQLEHKPTKKSSCIQIAKLMFEDFLSEDFKKQIQTNYWRKIQDYNTEMLQIFKSLNEVIYCSSSKKENIERFQVSLEVWKIFMRCFAFNAFSLDNMKKKTQKLALQIWNSFKQAYIVPPNSIQKDRNNIKINESLIQQKVNLKTLNETQKQEQNKFEKTENVSGAFLSQNPQLPKVQKDLIQKDQLNKILDFLFEQNIFIFKPNNLLQLAQKDKKEAQKLSVSSQWTSDQKKKLCYFIIFYHREVFVDSTRQYGIFHLMSKFIKTKTYEQCKSHFSQYVNPRIEKGCSVKRPPKDIVNELTLKSKIEDHQILSGIESQIKLPAQQLFLDLTNKKIYLYKNCRTKIDQYIRRFISKSVFKISFFE